MTNPQPERITKFHVARELGAYPLARRWVDHPPLQRPARDAVDHLEELAIMSALRSWLDAWMPINIHGALLAGATVEQVAAAMGTSEASIVTAWQEWDAGQRKLWQTFPDMDHSEEHDRVAAMLAEVVRVDREHVTTVEDTQTVERNGIRSCRWFCSCGEASEYDYLHAGTAEQRAQEHKDRVAEIRRGQAPEGGTAVTR